MGREFQIEVGPIERHDGEERCRVAVRVSDDLRYLEGHFPGDPIVPGIAQLLPIVHDPVATLWPDLGPCRAIKRLKFRAALRPGHALEVTLRRQGDKVRFGITRGETRCTDGVLVYG
ncbi:MAG TPA: hypothetical protein RMH99_00445 [Sandaracinaceae bacterium LLY-WYZ-13_1]|nr:hypothetical protein [Sandaracinaceae bacterium LLY-WYZ-13_1]